MKILVTGGTGFIGFNEECSGFCLIKPSNACFLSLNFGSDFGTTGGNLLSW